MPGATVRGAASNPLPPALRAKPVLEVIRARVPNAERVSLPPALASDSNIVVAAYRAPARSVAPFPPQGYLPAGSIRPSAIPGSFPTGDEARSTCRGSLLPVAPNTLLFRSLRIQSRTMTRAPAPPPD